MKLKYLSILPYLRLTLPTCRKDYLSPQASYTERARHVIGT